jgi:hypothetical protein
MNQALHSRRACAAQRQTDNIVIFIWTAMMNPHDEIQTIWIYEVNDGFMDQFRAAYGPDGKWVTLYRHCSGYIKTMLLQDLDNPNRFVAIDYWLSFSAYASMKEIVAPEYEYLVKQCKPYTASVEHWGIFESIDDWENEA